MCQARCTSNIGVVMNAARGRPIIRKNPAGQDIHFEVVCDGCNACPMVGIRYCSLTVPDHDLCEQCHSKPCSALAAPFERITSGAACHSMYHAPLAMHTLQNFEHRALRHAFAFSII